MDKRLNDIIPSPAVGNEQRVKVERQHQTLEDQGHGLGDMAVEQGPAPRIEVAHISALCAGCYVQNLVEASVGKEIGPFDIAGIKEAGWDSLRMLSRSLTAHKSP